MEFTFVIVFRFTFFVQRVIEIMILHGSADAIKSEVQFNNPQTRINY